ncbi:MAG: hypothetical protein ABEH56_04595 [Salinirussus sp.]
MDLEPGRRRFLTLAGTGAVFSLAGCPGTEGDTTSTSTTTAGLETDSSQLDESPDGDGERTAAVAVQPDQEELRQRQQQIQSQLQAGNITRREAQQQFQTAETELRGQAVASFREQVTPDTGIEITDAVDQFGILLLTGPASGLVDTLGLSEVSALLPRETFQQAKQQSRGTTESPTPAN